MFQFHYISSSPSAHTENFAHREDVRRTLMSSKEWSEYVKLTAESVTEPVGWSRVGSGRSA